MLKTFRALSLIEGLSLIALFFVAMPAKYYFQSFDIVFQVGMTHGILWLAYFVFSLVVSHKQGWSVALWAVVLIVSFVPFACFILDATLKHEMRFSQQNA